MTSPQLDHSATIVHVNQLANGLATYERMFFQPQQRLLLQQENVHMLVIIINDTWQADIYNSLDTLS